MVVLVDLGAKRVALALDTLRGYYGRLYCLVESGESVMDAWAGVKTLLYSKWEPHREDQMYITAVFLHSVCPREGTALKITARDEGDLEWCRMYHGRNRRS